MNFECKLCKNNYFPTNQNVVDHLKKVHKLREKKDQIECTVKNSKCGKFFQTFQGLSRHVFQCAADCETEHELERIDEFISVPENEDINQNSYIYDEAESNAENICDRSFICGEASAGFREQSFVYNSSTETSDSIAENFLMGLLMLNINEKTTNDVFRLAGQLLQDTHRFLQQRMAENGDNLQESVDCSMNFICNDLHKFDTSFKRRQFIESRPTFVKPQRVAIGTHIESRHDKDSHLRIQALQQSTFNVISPLEVIKKLFERPHFPDIYFEYNRNSKHVCKLNEYKDFCCGKVYKNLDLFEKYPESLQLQFFVDGFEICSALKSKTGLHSQVAVYMTIRNVPSRFAYNMENIFLICLINDNDLKKAETNYNNVWEQIVQNVRILETNGVDIGNGITMRGNLFFIWLLIECLLVSFFTRYHRKCHFR